MNYRRIELSKKQKIELAPFLVRINKKVKPLCVICFAASTKTIDAQNPLPFPASEQSGIYGVLIITAKKANRQYVQKLANSTAGYSRIVAIAHNWEYVKGKLQEKNFFFMVAMQGGFILSGSLDKPICESLSVNELHLRAQINFDYHIDYAIRFSEAASLCQLEDHEGSCLYLLYQAVLQACFTLIWVYAFYEPDFDNLDTLLNFCYSLEPRLEKYLPRDKSVDSSYFDALTGIYRHIHFNNDFEVIGRDVEFLANITDLFCEKVIYFCHERIDAYKELVIL
ncbi:hypothetical protein ABIB62_003764 [Mucilaginibacter sp. UYP25]|uniref:hypothetical protein n=1 Tax=unclassified Mucilaginibacter TaxID=2617802 RepID=UPI0033919748